MRSFNIIRTYQPTPSSSLKICGLNSTQSYPPIHHLWQIEQKTTPKQPSSQFSLIKLPFVTDRTTHDKIYPIASCHWSPHSRNHSSPDLKRFRKVTTPLTSSISPFNFNHFYHCLCIVTGATTNPNNTNHPEMAQNREGTSLGNCDTASIANGILQFLRRPSELPQYDMLLCVHIRSVGDHLVPTMRNGSKIPVGIVDALTTDFRNYETRLELVYDISFSIGTTV